MVNERWKLLANQDSSYVELYDIVSDPYESTDLKETQPNTVSKLSEQLADWKASLPESPDSKLFSSLRDQ